MNDEAPRNENGGSAKPRLFDLVVPPEKVHPSVVTIRGFQGSEPTRLAMERSFATFVDSDGNFIEQFQSVAFDARVFELFLHSYFTDVGFALTRPKGRPDFIIERNGLTVAVEATTSNPATRGAMVPVSSGDDVEHHVEADRPSEGQALPTAPSDEDLAKHRDRVEHELPIKIGSALYSKLQKRYWDLPDVEGRPFVLAVEAFHTSDSLYFSSAGISDYLFGVKQVWKHDADGALRVTNEPRTEHRVGQKVIPSHFFAQPDAEYVSAVLFTNSGTSAKFTRMGYQAGLHRGNLLIARSGYWPDPDPNSTTPRQTAFFLHEAPFFEVWGNGVTVFHNPNAKHPIPLDFFPDATQVYRRGDDILADGSIHSPYISRTVIVAFNDETFTPVDKTDNGVGTLLECEFDELEPARAPLAYLTVREVAWYASRDRKLLGVVFQDRKDEDYGFAVLGQDLNGVFRAIDIESEVAEAVEARRGVIKRLEERASEDARVFPQGDEEV